MLQEIYGLAAVCGYGIPWTFLLTFLPGSDGLW